MTRTFITTILILFCLAGVIAEESDIFVKTVPIEKVYLVRDGFRIVYAKNNMDIGEAYIPLSWFTYDPAAGGYGKGEVVYGNDAKYPYFSVFYKAGKFDHIRLYLRKDKRDESYGDLPVGTNLDGKFDHDTLDLQF